MTLIAGAWIGLLAPSAMAQTSTPPSKPAASAPAGGSTILSRSKTKLNTTTVKESSKTPASDNASKPAGGIKPTGRSRTYADPVLQGPRTVQARRDGSQTFFLPESDSGDVTIGPILRRPSAGSVTKADIRQEVLERVKQGRPLPTIDEVRESTGSTGSFAAREQQFEQTRQSYLTKGYMEGELDSGSVVFIKTDNWCKFHMVLDDIKRSIKGDTVSYEHAPDTIGRRGDDEYYRGDLIQGTELPRDRAPEAAADDTETASAFDAAALLLQQGDAAGAIKRLEAMLAIDAEDVEAVRLLGLAQLRSGKLALGIARMFEAYTTDPTLAASPIDPALLAGGAADLRDMAQRVVTIASKSKDPDASLVAAALFQAQGKADAARRMVDKAREKSLKAALLREFDLALGAGETKPK